MEPQIQMQGNLVADPVYRDTPAGVKMTKFRIACSGRRWDRTLNDFASTDPVYMSVVCWRQLATHVAQSLHKGDTVLVHGKLTFREYDDKLGGPRRQSYEIDASAVGPDLARYSAALTRPVRDVEPIPSDAAASSESRAPDDSRVPDQPRDPWSEEVPAATETAA